MSVVTNNFPQPLRINDDNKSTCHQLNYSSKRNFFLRNIMSKESNIQATERFGELVNTGRFDAFPEVVAPNCHDHDPAPGQHRGPEGYKTFFAQLRTAFPDMKVEVQKVVADGDDVAFAYTLTGTHQ